MGSGKGIRGCEARIPTAADRLALLLAEDAAAGRLRRDRRVVAVDGVVVGSRAERARLVQRVVSVLVVGVDDRREAGERIGRDAEVVQQVAVARAPDPALADGAEVDR